MNLKTYYIITSDEVFCTTDPNILGGRKNLNYHYYCYVLSEGPFQEHFDAIYNNKYYEQCLGAWRRREVCKLRIETFWWYICIYVYIDI